LRHKIGIRREDKNKWEARVPITPAAAGELMRDQALDIVIQPSPIRVFSDDAYREVGAQVSENLDDCPVVFAVKEIPTDLLRENRTYIYFSHTIKGQPYNMKMLQRLMELKCNLIDYETVVDGKGRRLVFFGRHAGLAGMIDTLWTLGKRLAWEGAAPNPFDAARQAHTYHDLAAVKEDLTEKVGEAIARDGLPAELCPMVFGFTGYGNVSRGAQEILDLLPVIDVDPGDLASLCDGRDVSRNHVYKTVFREEHMVTPREEGASFELQDYYDHPEKYRPVFFDQLSYLSVVVNCVYWTEKYPRLVTKEEIAGHWAAGKRAPGNPRFRVLGDISCDVEGSMEFFLKTTYTDNPVYVYDVATGEAVDGVAGNGPAVLAVDNLPCEISLESSKHFSASLSPFVFDVASADYGVSFDELALPAPIKRAMILHKGELTPDYDYMKKFIS
jgi:saccharopine dehydrogenase (NAD+, L-lysine forming)